MDHLIRRPERAAILRLPPDDQHPQSKRETYRDDGIVARTGHVPRALGDDSTDLRRMPQAAVSAGLHEHGG